MLDRRLALVPILAALVAGCGPRNVPLSADAMKDAKLRDVGELYRVHQIARNRPPRSLKDFAQVGDGTPSAFEAIRSGEVVVRWGATLPDLGEEPGPGSSDEVLAYHKDVPGRGGPVLMLDRSTRAMTAGEFQAARKAGTD